MEDNFTKDNVEDTGVLPKVVETEVASYVQDSALAQDTTLDKELQSTQDNGSKFPTEDNDQRQRFVLSESNETVTDDAQANAQESAMVNKDSFVTLFTGYFQYLVDLLRGKPVSVVYKATQRNMGYVALLVSSIFGGLTIANMYIIIKQGSISTVNSIITGVNNINSILKTGTQYAIYQPNWVLSYLKIFVIFAIITALLLLLRAKVVSFLVKRRESTLPFDKSLTVVGLAVGWRNIFGVVASFLLLLSKASFFSFVIMLIFYIFGLYIDLLLYICVSRFGRTKQSTIISYVLMKFAYMIVFILVTFVVAFPVFAFV